MKFGTYVLTPPTFMSYWSAILLHYLNNIAWLISHISATKRYSLCNPCNSLGYSRSTSNIYLWELFSLIKFTTNPSISLCFNYSNPLWGWYWLIAQPYRIICIKIRNIFTWLTIIIRFHVFIICLTISLTNITNTSSHAFFKEQIHVNVWNKLKALDPRLIQRWSNP